MKKLLVLIIFLNGWIAFSQPVRLSQLNFDHFSIRKKNISPEFSDLISKKFLNHPELGKMPFEAPPCSDCIELIDRRDAFSRYFVREKTKGSVFFQQKSSGPINYQDVNGVWKEINYRLEKKGNKLFEANNQPDQVSIDLQKSIIKLQCPEFKLESKIPELIWQEENGKEHSLGIANLKDYSAGDNGVKIHNIYSGIDLVISVRQGEIETNFVLNQKFPYNSGEIILRQQINLPVELSFSSEKSNGKENQEIYITDKNRIPFFIIEKGYAYENRLISNPFPIQSHIVKNKYLEFSIPLSWLSNPSTIYPVLIDPKISTQNSIPLIGINGTKYSPVCWADGCDYFMSVNSPPNSTITNIYHSFETHATGLCFAEDGGYSIDFQTCHSPSAAPGVYTNPVHISNAYYSANMILIPEFSSCIPAPTCAPQTLNFTLHFFRCNNDPDLNCTVNCIHATKPWTMIIEGYTVQLSSISAAQQICENDTAQLVVIPQYGVAPYSYSWTPGGSMNDTINVMPNTSTTYSVTVTDACGLTSSGTSTVNVISNSNPGFTIVSNPSCENSAVALNGNGAGASSNYDWIVTGSNVPGGILNDSQSPVISYSLPGNYQVILSYQNGLCNFNDTVPLTVSAISAVSVSLSAQPSGSICQGDTVIFKASSMNGGPNPSFEWLVDGISVQNGASDSLVTNALSNGSLVQTILHTSSSCASPLFDTASLLVALNSGLTPQVFISPDTALCPGSPLTLNTSTTNCGANPSYQWFANGNPVLGASSPSYSFIVTPPDTVISVEVTSSLSCVTSPISKDSTTVNILQNLQTTVNLTANPSGIICAGDSVHYTAHTQNGGGAPVFLWFINGILTAINDSIFSILPSNNDSISVQLISSLTCVVNSMDDDNKLVTVSPSVSPIVSLTATPSNIVCQGNTIVFSASAKNAGSFPVFLWTVNGNPVGSNDSIFSTSSLNNNDIVRIILNSSLSCAPISSDSDFIAITVVGNVMPSVSINDLGNAICEGDSIQFVALENNGGPAPIFQWFVNGVSTGLSNDTIVLTALNNGDTVYSMMTSSLGCVFPSSAFSPFYISTLQPFLMPKIDISVSPIDTICIGQKVILKANILNGGNSPSLQWYVNSILYPETTATFTSGTFMQGDIIVANMISNANCLLKSGDTSNFIRIVYYPPLNVQLISGPPDCPGSPANIKAQVTGGNGGPYHILWSNGIIDKDSIIIFPDSNTNIFVQADDNCTVQPATFSFTVPVLTKPIAEFAYVNPAPGSFQNNIQFINLSTNADNWIWIFPDVNTTSKELNPLHQFPHEGIYDVILATQSNDGCDDTIKYRVSVKEEIAVFYPNSFSPNGDGKNETFQPIGASLEDYEMTIWDRWGELIYKGNSKSAWNGMINNSSSPAPEGVYVFRIDLKEDKFEKRVVTGSVTLIR